ncbi:PD-(D/E)XK motif protein [Rhizobium leguminosarum]|uniref:PD-(D/E)XK motif protein n=1 Tax=Rhizobium leguminosarum TaxID=384 RepID=UPI001C949832|nr:PD-(D/E)XK motif protein [Rhizobium leguminosarum]MBY5917753.1 PD-(D/E)XK motif protein [Rhizobium leguminosarum]
MMNPQVSFQDPFWDWQAFERDYLSSAVPHRIVLHATPKIEIYVDGGSEALGAHIAVLGTFDGRLTVLFREIHLREVTINGERLIELSASKRSLFPSFFSLLREITALIVEKGAAPAEAIRAVIDRWETLLARQNALSEERQTGLFGELWLLQRLIATLGHAALSTWVGPLRQAHDFRIGNDEFEVKTTSSSERIHRINGLGQLMPSLGCDLYILSLQSTNAGSGGQTLPEVVASVAEILRRWPGEEQQFRHLLEKVGYHSNDEPLYTVRRRFRSNPIIIPVADGIPRLTKDAVMSLDARYSAGRILHVVYDIDVGGLGYSDGSEAFLKLLPLA